MEMTRRTLMAGSLCAPLIPANEKVGRAWIQGAGVTEYGYGFLFNLGHKEPIKKGSSVCSDYIISKSGVVVYQDIFPNIRQDKTPEGDLVVVITLNGKQVFILGQHLEVGDKVNVDVSSVAGIWRDMIVALDVRFIDTRDVA